MEIYAYSHYDALKRAKIKANIFMTIDKSLCEFVSHPNGKIKTDQQVSIS